MKKDKKDKKNKKTFIPWIFEKFKDDACIYMICPICNHAFPTNNDFGVYVPHTIFNYCPECGGRRWRPHTEINVIKNRRRLWSTDDD